MRAIRRSKDPGDGVEGLLDSSRASDFALAFARSRSFADDPGSLLRPLQRFSGPIKPFAETVLTASARFANELAESTRNAGRAEFRDSQHVSNLLLRLYQESLGGDGADRIIADRCLDAWDALLRQGVGGTRTHLRDFDI
jgi:hypothetical protein